MIHYLIIYYMLLIFYINNRIKQKKCKITINIVMIYITIKLKVCSHTQNTAKYCSHTQNTAKYGSHTQNTLK